MKSIELNQKLTLFFTEEFPKSRRKRVFKHRVVIGIGGNVGDVFKRFRLFYNYMSKDRRFNLLETSPILKNPPFGYKKQKDFLNAVAILQTSLSPKEVLKVLLHIERAFKRERSFKNAPRTLDLDIIFFDSIRLRSKRLILPHPRWQERESVLIPLSYLTLFK